MRSLKLSLLFIARSLGLFRLASWLTRGRLKILCYHGFALDDEAAFWPTVFIRPSTFEARLETLRRYGFRVLPLGEGVERLYAGTLPDRSVVITVDDGFHSVRRVAVPALERRRLTATVYVTTYYVEHANPIFRLVVQYMFWKTPRRTLLLEDVPWSEDTEVDLSDRTQQEAAAWNCIRYGETQCTEEERCAIGRRLGELLEVPYGKIEADRILHLMTPQELRELAGKGIDIQLHTHRHVFPQDDRARAEREIEDNRAALRRMLGNRSFEHFCYPSGLWAENQWAWLTGAGVKTSTTCLHGFNSRHSPPQALRRYLDAEEIHALEFEAFLTGFSEVTARLRRLARATRILQPVP
jgi:peptidoglycan/xylan/chitin deacetylase (PgdA/CDA1 family)